MATRTKTKVAASAQQLIAGTTQHLGQATSILLQAQSLSVDQVVERLRTIVALRNEVEAAKAQTKARLAAESAAMPALRAFYGAYEGLVKAAFDGAPDVLADFGLHPKARAPLTALAKVAAAAKRKATREARHTMGSRQREAVQGDVTGVVVTPIVTAPAPPRPR